MQYTNPVSTLNLERSANNKILATHTNKHEKISICKGFITHTHRSNEHLVIINKMKESPVKEIKIVSHTNAYKVRETHIGSTHTN